MVNGSNEAFNARHRTVFFSGLEQLSDTRMPPSKRAAFES
jgi:hypothetical protein